MLCLSPWLRAVIDMLFSGQSQEMGQQNETAMKIPPSDNKNIYDKRGAKRPASDGLYGPVRSFD